MHISQRPCSLFGVVRPYIHGPLSLLEFVVAVFGAKELERHEFGPDKCHAELQLGDSVLVIEAGGLPSHVEGWVASIYVYVPDVDAAYTKAMQLGATSISEPVEKPYQERQAGFRDSAGNTWWISTYKGDL